MKFLDVLLAISIWIPSCFGLDCHCDLRLAGSDLSSTDCPLTPVCTVPDSSGVCFTTNSGGDFAESGCLDKSETPSWQEFCNGSETTNQLMITRCCSTNNCNANWFLEDIAFLSSSTAPAPSLQPPTTNVIDQSVCSYLPFGPSKGDASAALSGEAPPQVTGPFTLDIPIVYYLQRESHYYLSQTGVLLFEQGLVSSEDDFSSLLHPLIAPAWSEISQASISGTLYHRVSRNQTTLNLVKGILRSGSVNMFQPSLAVILTGVHDELGTMQMVLSTDGNVSFASFVFDRNEDVGHIAVTSGLAVFSAGDQSRTLAAEYPANTDDGRQGMSNCVDISFRIDGYCVSSVSSRDICDLTSYTVDCEESTATSTSCRCRRTSNNFTMTTCICGAELSRRTLGDGSLSVVGCYPTLLPCYVSDDVCPADFEELDCEESSFVLFGEGAGDQAGPRLDDASINIILTVPVVFYGTKQTSLYVSTNGLVSFQANFLSFQVCPLSCTPVPVILPLWADLDFSNSGFVFHRQTQDQATLDQVAGMITTANPRLNGYQPTLAIVVTWFEARKINAEEGDQGNTFQLVLSTDGNVSFAAFLYQNPLSISNELLSLEEREAAMIVGFDPGAGTGLTPVDYGSVVGVRATNIFRIDGSCITGVRANEVCDLDTFARQCNGIRHTNCSTSDMGGEGTSEPDAQIIPAVVGGVAGFLVLCVVLLIPACICCIWTSKKRRAGKIQLMKKSEEDTVTSTQRGSQHGFDASLKFSDTTMMRVNSSFNLKVPKSLLVKSCNLKLGDTIGQGEFGIVYKASLKRDFTNNCIETVAVKTLKGFVEKDLVKNLLRECAKMKDFDHPNVLKLKGVCLDGGPAPFIIMPFMTCGSLHGYLRKNRALLVMDPSSTDTDDTIEVQKKLLDMCIQVAKGMEYLAGKRVVHRDLAARNCMIDSGFVIKVADFGLSESMDTSKEYFRQSQDEIVKLPIKWMAPETLNDACFSKKSDVWAFGVTCWEVFSGAKVPYAGVHPLELGPELDGGFRMCKPPNAACTDQVYDIIYSCWKEQPQQRPNFSHIVTELCTHLSSLADYLTFAPTITDIHVNLT